MSIKHDATLKIMLLGDEFVGKTSIYQKYTRNVFPSEYKATFGADFLSRELDIDGEQIRLFIWDCAGLEFFRKIIPIYYKKTDICIFVYDATRPETFEHIQKWYDDFSKELGLSEDDDFPFMILGNKSDLPNKLVQPSSVSEFIQKNRNMIFHEVSAKSFSDVCSSFEDIVKKALQMNKKTETSAFNLTSDERLAFDEYVEAVYNYIRFLEDHLGNYEEVDPLNSENIEELIAIQDIKVGEKRKHNKNAMLNLFDSLRNIIISFYFFFYYLILIFVFLINDCRMHENSNEVGKSRFELDEKTIEERIEKFENKSEKEKYEIGLIFMLNYVHYLEKRINKYENLDQFNFKLFNKYRKLLKK